MLSEPAQETFTQYCWPNPLLLVIYWLYPSIRARFGISQVCFFFFSFSFLPVFTFIRNFIHYLSSLLRRRQPVTLTSYTREQLVHTQLCYFFNMGSVSYSLAGIMATALILEFSCLGSKDCWAQKMGWQWVGVGWERYMSWPLPVHKSRLC